jgi:cyclase
MRRVLPVITIATLLLITTSWLEGQNAPPQPLPSKLEKIANDLYVIRGEGGNTTVYLTDEGVVLVDVKFDRNFDDIQAKVRSLTDKPVRYIFNTHSHGDHTGGNPKFLPAAQIIAHQNARTAMIQGKQPGPPQLTYTEEMSVNIGGKEVIAHYFGRGHTDGDTWVYFPAAKVLASGDAFNTGNGQGQTGSLTYGLYIAPGGSIVDISNTSDGVLKKWDFDTVVPGHGPIGKRADLIKWRDEIGKLRNRISGMLREGKNKDEVTKMLIDEFGWDPKGRGTLNSVDSMMSELKASN